MSSFSVSLHLSLSSPCVVVCCCRVVLCMSLWSRRVCVRCVHSKRLRVYKHHVRMWKHLRAWCRYTRGRFECRQGGKGRFERTHGERGGRWEWCGREEGGQRDTPTPTHCTPNRHTHNAQRNNAQTNNSQHARWHRQFCLPKFAHVGLSLDPTGSPKKPLDVTHSNFENWSSMFPIPPIISLYLLKLFNSSSPEGHCGENQPPDGSICLSPPKPKYNERFARQTLSMVFG